VIQIEFKPHALRRMEERDIEKEEIELVMRDPREAIQVKFGRLAAFNYINEKGLVVIYQKQNNKIEVVTAIWADKRRLRRYGFTRV
jgi:hypothetical protein